MSYKVQFLDDDLFEQLPGRDMETKVGVAYPSAGLAFARKSGIPVMDAMTALHELEHLSGNELDERIDPEYGCYYKGFGDVLQTAAPIALGFMLPGIGSALGPVLGGIGSGLSGIGSGIASGLGSIPGIGGALGGAAQSIGGALGSMGQGIGGALGGGGFGLGDAMSMGQNLFGGSPMDQFQMPDFMGSFNPSVYSSPGANVIPGGSGAGPGGFGGGPGLGGGGQVAKLKGQLAQQGNTTGGQQ